MSDDVTDLVLEDAGEQMAKAVAYARSEFAGVRTGRATPALIEKIPVEYYGSEVPLQQIASFSVPEARQLLVNPYDKGAMGAIEKAIQNANLGLNPSNDGVSIRLSFPALTTERRKELVKVVRAMAEDARIAVRGHRRTARHELEKLEKDSELSEDELRRAEAALDKLTHAHESEIDQTLAVKEKELLED